MTEKKMSVVQGTPEWNAMFEALGQFVTNTGHYLGTEEEGADPKAALHYKHASVLLAQMNEAHAALAGEK